MKTELTPTGTLVCTMNRGEDFLLEIVEVVDENDDPIDLSTSTFQSELRDKEDVLIATLSVTGQNGAATVSFAPTADWPVKDAYFDVLAVIGSRKIWLLPRSILRIIDSATEVV